jgi:hypothetical protein
MQPAALQQGDGGHQQLGRAVHVEPVKPMLKAPGTERLKLRSDELLSNLAFKFNLRHYNSFGFGGHNSCCIFAPYELEVA